MGNIQDHPAYKVGQTAFAEGRKSVPVHDPALVKMVNAASRKHESVLPVLDAWARGWHTANLAAPLE